MDELCTHLSSTVPKKTIAEVNDQVRDVIEKGKKRGEYSKHPESDKIAIAKYASEHGVA